MSSIDKSTTPYVKLPKITIPVFSGLYGEWTTFKDLFTALVHTNPSLSDVQKLQYLKSHLAGEAEKLIRQIPITESNYTLCWSQLEKRFSNKKYLVNCILKRLFSQKQILVESAVALKNLLDTTNDCLNAFTNLNINVTSWDVIIIHILTSKLDPETRKNWELSVCHSDSNNELPTFKEFQEFIEKRFRALEFIEPNKKVQQTVHFRSHNQVSQAMVATSSNNRIRCEFCSEVHKLCFCKKFAQENMTNRREYVIKNKICFNCLGSNHIVHDCKITSNCKICHKRHHTLLHPEGNKVNDITASTSSASDQENSSTSANGIVSCLSTGKVLRPKQVLLATALINVMSKTGQNETVRALLDQGSQACFITEATVQFLNLKKIPAYGLVSVLGNNKQTMIKHMVYLTIQSKVDPNFSLQLNAFVLSKITSYLPERCINTNTFDWLDISTVSLADPQFNTPNKIDILLGADVYSYIVKEGMKKSPNGALMAQNTALGWILSGVLNPVNKSSKNVSICMHTQIQDDHMLKRFWEIEDQLSSKKILTYEEQKCEELYSTTTKRSSDGTYEVKLPFRDDDPPCKSGNSRAIAKTRFKALEKRLERDTDLKYKYTEVIDEYLRLGHMRRVNKNDTKQEEAVYLPHHAVIRNDKATTKVRVVFNASEKNSKGVSLNDTLLIGPKLQADLRHTVLRWRVHPIGLVADIVKMYRQVRIAEEDVMYQRILWRDNPNKEIEDYELMTVTFGTASAPFQAVRTLHQVAYDEGKKYPLAADKVLNCFYMDDLMTGCETVKSGLEIYKQMNGLLEKGGFTLQKWNSNNQEILEKIKSAEVIDRKGRSDQTKKSKVQQKDNKERYNLEDKEKEIKLDSTIKILGLTWNCSDDTFQYSVNLRPLTSAPVTKRTIISDIARLFDPLGWLAPSVVLAKIFIQKLWLAGIGWDEAPSIELIKEWCTYREELSLLTRVRIPRWLGTRSNCALELHGFCDASKAAYSAVVYLRITNPGGDIQVSLLVAKTRVAPINQITIPRLELCGAVLLSKLLTETSDILSIPADKVKAWTDSMVVLAWLSSHPSRWKTFVGNRTSEILSSMKSSQWFHISTKDNPADCASRGVLPSALLESSSWFCGPSFLKDKTITYKRPNHLNIELEQAINSNVVTTAEDCIFERFSSLHRLIRVIAYCRRFLNKNKTRSYLQKIELEASLECCIRKTQMEKFRVEYKQLETKGYIQLKFSKLKSLCPYLDTKGIMRVRGRLEKSQLDEQMKHPIILPESSNLTRLIIADAHNKTLHGGPQLMMNYLRTAYWILGVRNRVKAYVRQCVICVRQRSNIRNQLMGSLPSVRCTPSRPFLHSGVDYAGPFNIRTTKGRGQRAYKGYICLFVCMSTRAIHLEVVSDMTTQSFLAAFRRFVSRRGHCAKLWSDNGTTFIGASKELQQLKLMQPLLGEYLEANGTEWHFIPPQSPNFGGLWEAGVKSSKFHLKRVIGDATLTYEEMTTLLNQVEACLNSRPMSVMRLSDPGEPSPLTPGHFLIGEPLVNVPDYSYEMSNVSSLTRWQFVQRMLQSFWKRWSQEYLSNLVNRYKWSRQVPEPKIGDVVLIKEDNLPPSRWLFGRVVQKHPGDDNVTRVVSLRTKSSTIKRPTSKLCILPTAE